MNMRERGFEVRRATRASRVAVLVLLIAARHRGEPAVLGRPRHVARLHADRGLPGLCADVEPARGLRRDGVDRAAGVLRHRRIRDADSRQLWRHLAVHRGADCRRDCGRDRGSGVARGVPARRRLLRDRHMGDRGSVQADGGERIVARRRIGHESHGVSGRAARAARIADAMDGARDRRRGDRPALSCSCARSAVSRSPRCATTRSRRTARVSM